MTLLRSFLLSLALVFSTGTVAVSQDFDKGLDAYYKGDYASALKEWRPLAEQGDAHAQFNLALMYANGKGVPQDDREAVKWYRLAAEQGDAKAQSNLALMYLNGEGVPQDDREAVKWYRLAAEQGHAHAQNGLGWMYYTGKGVPQDFVLAHMWYNVGSANGNALGGSSRDIVGKMMSPADISKAQSMASRCMASNYQDCGR